MPTNPVIDHIDYNNITYDIKDTTSGYTTNIGTITDVKVGTTSSNASSVVSGSVATLLVNTAYNASTNKIATMSDIAAVGGVTNITAIYNAGLWTYPTKTPTELKTDFDAGKSVIITFTYRIVSPIDGNIDTISVGKMLEYSDNMVVFSTLTNTGKNYQNFILYLIYSSNAWSNGYLFNIPMPDLTSQVRLELQNTTSNLNEWTLPGTYIVEDGETYTNLPSLPGYEFTSGIVEVFGSKNYTGLTQRFIVQNSNSSESNIYAIRHKTGNNWESWYFDNNMSSYLKWDTGSHNADYAVPGTTWCRAGSSYTTNLPVTTGYGVLTTTGHWELDSGVAHQTYSEYSTASMNSQAIGYYVRDNIGGGWSPWVKIGPASYTDANNISY